MPKTILITGATDGIGRATALALREQGHHLLIHGRNPTKLAATVAALQALPGDASVESYQADFANLAEVAELARAVTSRHDTLDVLINNAGILRTDHPRTSDGLDVRMVVNTLAPYLLTQRLRPLLGPTGRVVNLSSAAQAPVNLSALSGESSLDAMGAYAQSKLALTMWTRHLATVYADNGPAVYAVNPGSLLATKMVREGFGTAGSDIRQGVDILTRAALSEEFIGRSGQYFDNDSGRFASPHPDALDPAKCAALVRTVDTVLAHAAPESVTSASRPRRRLLGWDTPFIRRGSR